MVTSDGNSSSSAVQVATVIALPTVTGGTLSFPAATTITGTGFDSNLSNYGAGISSVVFLTGNLASGSYTTTPGAVTAASSTSLTVAVNGILEPAGYAGPVYVVVVNNGVASSDNANGVQLGMLAPPPVVIPSTTPLFQAAATLSVAGGFFDSTAANNSIALTPTGTATISSSTTSSLNLTSLSGLSSGAQSLQATDCRAAILSRSPTSSPYPSFSQRRRRSRPAVRLRVCRLPRMSRREIRLSLQLGS